MRFFELEQSPLAYRADFVLYGLAVLALAGLLVMAAPAALTTDLVLWTVAGGALWSVIEYGFHRFLFHGLAPFSGWHAQHHERPTALIGTPTVLSALMFVVLVFLPAWGLLHLWRACALTLGVLCGYLAYSLTHHATHHWRSDSAWLRQRKQQHALHHHHKTHPVCFGVTTSLWDRLFGTVQSGTSRGL